MQVLDLLYDANTLETADAVQAAAAGPLPSRGGPDVPITALLPTPLLGGMRVPLSEFYNRAVSDAANLREEYMVGHIQRLVDERAHHTESSMVQALVAVQ